MWGDACNNLVKIYYLLVAHAKAKNIKLQFYLLFCMGVKHDLSQKGRTRVESV
jgi:hypothetical protein